MSLEYTSDSDVSDDTRDLVQRGLATVKRKRMTVAFQSERLRERPLVPNMDISHIRYPSNQDGLNGATSTHGLNPVGRELYNGQNYNSIPILFTIPNVHCNLMSRDGTIYRNYSMHIAQ